MFSILLSAVGVNITADYVDWGRTLYAIFADTFQKVARPIELDDLARLARINITPGSMFQFHWLIFGTVLPKVFTSRGDGQWGRRLAELLQAFQDYTSCDTLFVSCHASVLSMCICIQTFPDLTILKEVSGLGTIALMNWFQFKFLCDHMAG